MKLPNYPADHFDPCRQCSECDGNHHWGEGGLSFAHNEPGHDAAQAGLDAWYQCKHCEAWAGYCSLEMCEGGPVFPVVGGTCDCCGAAADVALALDDGGDA